jgi:hypothetical protein
MSFGWFIYYCAAWGGFAAFVGWTLGRLIPAQEVLGAGVKAMCLGALLGLGLACVEAVVGGSALRHASRLASRASMALLVGATGGWIGGALGQFLFGLFNRYAFLVFGWALTGLLIGAAPAAFDVLAARARGLDASGAWRKVRNGVVGGTLGGLLGSGLYLFLVGIGSRVFTGRSDQDLWTPSSTGFVALGACIGLAVGLAQVLLKEAWVHVDAGFRAGRQLILSRPETTIGRGEACDLGLFGDAGVERVHARILRMGGAFVLVDNGSAGGTFVNDEPVTSPTPLSSGDRIRLGNSLLSFRERPRRPER